jgi:hypothetical protein
MFPLGAADECQTLTCGCQRLRQQRTRLGAALAHPWRRKATAPRHRPPGWPLTRRLDFRLPGQKLKKWIQEDRARIEALKNASEQDLDRSAFVGIRRAGAAALRP